MQIPLMLDVRYFHGPCPVSDCLEMTTIAKHREKRKKDEKKTQ